MAMLGGWPLAVARHAYNPEAAITFVREAASYEQQLQRVLENPWRLPSLSALYDNPQVIAAAPHFAEMKQLLQTNSFVRRPSKIAGPHYSELSHRYTEAVRRILTRRIDAATETTLLQCMAAGGVPGSNRRNGKRRSRIVRCAAQGPKHRLPERSPERYPEPVDVTRPIGRASKIQWAMAGLRSAPGLHAPSVSGPRP